MTKKTTPEQTQLELPIEEKHTHSLFLVPEFTTISTLCAIINLMGIKIDDNLFKLLPPQVRGHFINV